MLHFKTLGVVGNIAYYFYQILTPAGANGWDFHAPKRSTFLSAGHFYCIAPDGANGWSARATYEVKRRWTGMLRTNAMQYHPQVAAMPGKVLLFQIYGRKIVEFTWVAQIINATLVS